MQGDPFGVSFSPVGQGQGGNQAQNAAQQTPVQQAIQTLSLRIPRTVGAGSIAPGQLLNAAGGSGLGGNPDAASMLEMIKRMLFGQPGQMGTGPQMPRSPGQPTPGQTNFTPHFTPIEGTGAPAQPPTPPTPAAAPLPGTEGPQGAAGGTTQRPGGVFDTFRG